MIHFTSLIRSFEAATVEQDKEAILIDYFKEANGLDTVWAIALFYRKKPKRLITNGQLTDWAIELTKFPVWLVNDSMKVAGDVSETIALLLPETTERIPKQLNEILIDIVNLQKSTFDQKRDFILNVWKTLSKEEIVIFNKIITGTFNVKLTSKVLIQSLADAYHLPVTTIATSLSGNWSPETTTFEQLLSAAELTIAASKPYAFNKGNLVENEDYHFASDLSEWIVEWHWQGIRVQLVRRAGHWFLWNQNEELITAKIQELNVLAKSIPDGTVIEGYLMFWHEGKFHSGNLLHNHLDRQTVNKKDSLSYPVSFMAVDLLEWDKQDICNLQLIDRRSILSELIHDINAEQLKFSPVLSFENWQDLTELRIKSRAFNADGLVLKRKNSSYLANHEANEWWYWKASPFVTKAVLMYVQVSRGSHEAPFSDFTFGVWNGAQLISFAKAQPDFSQSEWLELRQFIKNESIEKFGPVRTLPPKYVFEIQFDHISHSKRHKSGLLVQNAIILKWLIDAKPETANSLDDLRSLIQ